MLAVSTMVTCGGPFRALQHEHDARICFHSFKLAGHSIWLDYFLLVATSLERKNKLEKLTALSSPTTNNDTGNQKLQKATADAERHRERVEAAERRLKDEESAKLAAESSKNKVGWGRTAIDIREDLSLQVSGGVGVACEGIAKPATPYLKSYLDSHSLSVNLPICRCFVYL